MYVFCGKSTVSNPSPAAVRTAELVPSILLPFTTMVPLGLTTEPPAQLAEFPLTVLYTEFQFEELFITLFLVSFQFAELAESAEYP